MTGTDWKARLTAVIDSSPMSQREISLKAGCGPGYLHSILKENKDPTIKNLTAICKAAGASLYYVLGGFDMDQDKEELLRLLSEADEDTQKAVLTILRRGQLGADKPEPLHEMKVRRSPRRK